MIFQFSSFSFYFDIAAIIVLLVIALAVWTRRPAPGAVPFSLFLLAVIVWIFIRSFAVAAVEFETKIFLGELTYMVTIAICILWLSFALDYSGSVWWKRPRNLILLCLVPIATAIILIINRPEVLTWLLLIPDVSSSTSIIVWQKGPFTLLQVVYIYSILLAGTLLLLRYTFRVRPGDRWKTIAILIGALIPITAHGMNAMGIFPIPGLDVTAIALFISSIILATIVLRFRFLDIVPVARGVLVENLPDGILVLDRKGVVADLNPSAAKIIGLSQATASGKLIADICPWLNQLILSNSNNEHTGAFSVLAGTGQDLEINILPLKNQKSSFKGLLVVLKDVTERKKTGEALQDSEEKYRSLVHNIMQGVFRITPSGRYLEVNQAMETITGYSREELLNIDINDLYVHPVDWQEILNQSVSTPKKANQEAWIKKKDGTLILIAVSITPVRNPDGSILYCDGIQEDITEKKKLVEQIKELYEKEKQQRLELEEEAKARGLFISVLGHELRTPLTSIITSADLLKNSSPKDPESIEARLIGNVFKGAQALVQRLDELLELGRFSRGEVKLRIQSFDIKQLVESVASRFRPEVQVNGQQLVLDLASKLPPLPVDPFRLEEVLVNLLSNASRFSPPGGKVFLRTKEAYGGVLVEVQDEGKEISLEEQKRLFQPYHRIEQDRSRFPGLGLGLAISRQIIEAHQGRIWVTSYPGKGNTFSILLRVKPQANETGLTVLH
jgi:PAS domain S-box-containing protein